MTSASDLASLAAVLADQTRAAMCLALLDGRAWTAGELATHTGVASSTATEHLHRLHRRRAARRAAPGPSPVRPACRPLRRAASGGPDGPDRAPPGLAAGLRAVTASAAPRRGRTCYDHLAGQPGVAMTDAMTRAGLLDQTGGFALTPAGLAWLTDTLGLSPDGLRPDRRPLARGCLDWTERRQHLAGVAGAKLCDTFLGNGWIARVGSGRAVRLTPNGKAALLDLLGLSGAD